VQGVFLSRLISSVLAGIMAWSEALDIVLKGIRGNMQSWITKQQCK
jgi:hypothetical protein